MSESPLAAAERMMPALVDQYGLEQCTPEEHTDMTFHFRWEYQYWKSILEHAITYSVKPGTVIALHFVDIDMTVRPVESEGVAELVEAYYDLGP